MSLVSLSGSFVSSASSQSRLSVTLSLLAICFLSKFLTFNLGKDSRLEFRAEIRNETKKIYLFEGENGLNRLSQKSVSLIGFLALL